MKVRDNDVLLPTTLVGAYPRQVFMQGPVFGAGVNDKEYPNYRTRELYRAAVALTVKDQEDVGIDVVTDGAQHYENETDWELAELFHTMPHHLDGYVPYGDDVVLGTNTLAVYKPTVVGEVGWRRPVFKPRAGGGPAATDKPLKINIGLGPTTLALLSTDKHYGDVKALAFAIADAYNAEFKDLAARGLEQVQFAEPLVQFAGLMELESWMVDVLNRCFDGVDMYRVVHLCYGHEQGQPSFAPDWVSADKVFPFAFDIECAAVPHRDGEPRLQRGRGAARLAEGPRPRRRRDRRQGPARRGPRADRGLGPPHVGDRARRAAGAVHGLRAVVGAPDRGPQEAREHGEGRRDRARRAGRPLNWLTG